MAFLVDEIIPAHTQKYLFPLHGKRMLELGNKRTHHWIWKDYFTSLGMEHVSIDWNGLDGALNLDLRQPISLEPFDMITNFGTTEHVDGQDGVWKNIHNLLKVGGVLVSHAPKPGDWWWHGFWHVDEEFYKYFAKNGYEIEMLGTERERPNQIVAARLRKVEDKPFIMPPKKTIHKNNRRPKYKDGRYNYRD